VIRNKIALAKAAAADKYSAKRMAVLDTVVHKLTVTNIPIGWKKSFFEQRQP